jgi:hypothetical protein
MTPFRCALVALVCALVVGCSSQPQGEAAPEFTVLQEVNDLLRAATGAAGRPPARLADLDRYQSMFPRAYAAVQSGNVVVVWGAALKGEGDASQDQTVVAYEKAAPTDGGHVLLSGGAVKKMTAAEFGAAPKAAPK